MLAKERDVLTEIHIFEMIGNKTAIAPLYTFSELSQV